MDRDLVIKCKHCGNEFTFPAGENAVPCPFCDRPNERPKDGNEGAADWRAWLLSLCRNDYQGFVLLLLAFSCQGVLPPIVFSLLIAPELLGKTMLLALPPAIYAAAKLYIRLFRAKDTSAFSADSGFSLWVKVISGAFAAQKVLTIAAILSILFHQWTLPVTLSSAAKVYLGVCVVCGIAAIFLNMFVIAFHRTPDDAGQHKKQGGRSRGKEAARGIQAESIQ